MELREITDREAVAGCQLSPEMVDVLALAYQAHAAIGRWPLNPGGLYALYRHLDGIPQTTVACVYDDEEMVGTCSFTLDGPKGLHVEEDYPNEVERLRAAGLSLAASWRIATLPKYREESRVVRLLQRWTIEIAAKKSDVLLCTFHPDHESVYRRLWGFETIGRCESTAGLENAPSVLMGACRTAMEAKLAGGHRACGCFLASSLDLAGSEFRLPSP